MKTKEQLRRKLRTSSLFKTLSNQQSQSLLRRAKYLYLTPSTISLSDKYSYCVLAGKITLTVVSKDETTKLYFYQQGSTFKLIRQQSRRVVGCDSGTIVAVMPPFQIKQVANSPTLSRLDQQSRQFLSTRAENNQFRYGQELYLEELNYLHIIKSGQLLKSGQQFHVILGEGEQVGEEIILGKIRFSVKCNSTTAKLTRLLTATGQADKLYYFIYQKKNIQLRKCTKRFKLRPIQSQFDRKQGACSQELPLILANTHLLLRIKVHKPVIRQRAVSQTVKK